MRVSPPDLLKMDRHQLLRDVRERLAERAPQLAEGLDRSHPAWIVLEEAAWMVETLSGQLDEWPWAVLQQFAHLLGASVQPATPAVGVVVVTAGLHGRMQLGDNPARWRFMCPQTEERGLVEFALAEPDVPLTAGAVASVARLVGGELFRGAGPAGSELPDAWHPVGAGGRSRAFARETIRFQVVGADVPRLRTEFTEAVEKLEKERPVGWLRFEVRQADAQTAELLVWIDPAVAFAGGAGEPGDAVASWAPLDDSTWTPPVRISDHPLLPPALRGARPLPVAGGLLVPDVPANMLRNEILEREARPAPADLPNALWRTLAHLDTRLAPLRPRVIRGAEVVAGDPTEPTWIEGALRSGAWFRVAAGGDQTLGHVALSPSTAASTVRVGWVRDPGPPPEVRVFALDPRHGLLPDELPWRQAWSLSLPSPRGGGMLDVTAADVQVPAGADGLLVAIAGEVHGLMLNPLLVVNAPAVRDGRRVTVARAVPEPVSLLHHDIVTAEVMERVAASGIDPAAAEVLRRVPLALAELDGEPLRDFVGVQVDPTEGTLTLNAPDDLGRVREIRRGDEVHLAWYRWTQAAAGNVGAGEIRLVEQGPSVRPRITGVTNPLPTAWGAERERDEDAVARVFGPQTGVPVTSGDWERLVRAALGRRAAGWVVRVWGYPERTLMSSELWPLPFATVPGSGAGPAVDPERTALGRALETAGPDVLLVALGPAQGTLADDDLEQARRTCQALVARWAERIPTVRRVLVARLWPLVAVGTAPGPFPRFSLSEVRGELVDARGRRASVPAATLLLNAAIVGCEP